MSMRVTRLATHEEITSSLTGIASALDRLAPDFWCVVHSMQPRRAGYYASLEKEFQIKVLSCSSSSSRRGLFVDRMLGRPGIVVLKDPHKLSRLFLRVAEQGMAGLYVGSGASLDELWTTVRPNNVQLLDAVQDDSTHLTYQLDEDAASEDGLVPEIISVGDKCPPILSSALTRNNKQ